jgi:hypothetical protein
MNVRQAGAADRAHRFRNAGFDNERTQVRAALGDRQTQGAGGLDREAK